MFLFDTGKKLEKAVGEEAASIIMQVLEQHDEAAKKEAANKADLRETELRLETKIEAAKHETLKWLIGMAVAQTGVLTALYALMK